MYMCESVLCLWCVCMLVCGVCMCVCVSPAKLNISTTIGLIIIITNCRNYSSEQLMIINFSPE